MEINVTEISPCYLKVNYIADAGEILNKRGEVLEAFKKAPVKGYRPGKADIQAIKIHYRDQIEESLKRALAEDAYHNTVFEKQLRPHGAPKINSALLESGKFTCEFELYTKPDFNLAPYKDVEIVKPHPSKSIVEMTEAILQDLRVRNGEMTPYTENDIVQDTDHIILNYEGFILDENNEPQKVDILSAEGELMVIGKSEFKAFDEQLLGMKMGETKEFNFLVPDTGLPSLAGKTVKFIATVTMGSKVVPCALDDNLAKKLNKETYQELRDLVQSKAQADYVQKEKTALNEAVCNKLVADNQVSVPSWMSISEGRYLAHRAKLDWDKMPNEDKEKYLEMATNNCKVSLILDKVREEDPEAQLSDQEVFEMIKQNILKSKSSSTPDQLLQELNRTGQLAVIQSRIKDEFALDHIIKSMKIIEN